MICTVSRCNNDLGGLIQASYNAYEHFTTDCSIRVTYYFICRNFTSACLFYHYLWIKQATKMGLGSSLPYELWAPTKENSASTQRFSELAVTA